MDERSNEVTLSDGRKVSSYSKEWLMECRVRDEHVRTVCGMLGKANRSKRDAYCTRVGHLEGAESERRLRERLREVWPKGSPA